MKLFTLGPVEMYPYTLEKSAEQIPYFRTPEFSKVVLESEQYLKELAFAEDDARVVFLTTSGTGAMEASIINCLTPSDKALVIDGGSFGHRFAEMCKLHNIPYEVIKLEQGEALTADHFKPYDDCGITAVLVNIDETSTGQLYPIDVISDFCRRNGNAFLIVDAISSFLVDEYKMAEYGIDVTIMSSQKALALAPGLSAVILSRRALDERVAVIESGNMYMDFKDHLKNGDRGQTPFTPAVGVILQLHQRLMKIREYGIDNVIADAGNLAKDFRERVKELPVSVPDYPLSNACTPLVFETESAYSVYEKIKNEYDMVLTPNGGELKDRIVRVGHLGNHTIEDNTELIEALKAVLNEGQE